MEQLVADNSTENLLIERASSGSDEAFEEIVRLHQRLIRAFVASRVSDRSAVDEIAQSVFVAAYRNLSAFRGTGTLGGWLLGIAKNHVLSWLRERMARRERTVSIEGVLEAAQFGDLDRCEPDADEELQRLELLRVCLQSLDERQRDLVHRFYFLEESAEDIAVSLQRPPGTVRMTLLRIRRLLHGCINKKLSEGRLS